MGTDDEGYELHPTFRAREGEIVVDKWTFGAFASTFLERELMARGVKRILLCGLARFFGSKPCELDRNLVDRRFLGTKIGRLNICRRLQEYSCIVHSPWIKIIWLSWIFAPFPML